MQLTKQQISFSMGACSCIEWERHNNWLDPDVHVNNWESEMLKYLKKYEKGTKFYKML